MNVSNAFSTHLDRLLTDVSGRVDAVPLRHFGTRVSEKP
jgi:hypothetical protein